MLSFTEIKKIFEEYSFEIVIIACVLFILLYFLYTTIFGIRGTWSDRYYYLQPQQKENRKIRGDSKGEVECRRVMENIFKRPFNKSRPDFLNNPVTGGNFNLELDCYNEDLGIAVEYHGIQHTKYTPYFHKNYEAFLNQKYRDDMKRRICKEKGIYLIEVYHDVKIHDIEGFIINKLKKINML
jgi:hypothetical protein